MLAVERLGVVAEGPAVLEHQRLDDGDADDLVEPLQLADDERAVRPGAGERDVEMVASGRRLEAGASVGGHPVAKAALVADEGAARPLRLVAALLPVPLDEKAAHLP